MRTLAVFFLMAAAGCHVPIGFDPALYPPARRATGTTAYVSLAAASLQGELLEVRDTALVLRTVDSIVLVLTSRTTSLDFEDHRRRRRVHDSLTAEEREKLRLLSRYPQGIPPAALAQLLADRGQTTLKVIDK